MRMGSISLAALFIASISVSAETATHTDDQIQSKVMGVNSCVYIESNNDDNGEAFDLRVGLANGKIPGGIFIGTPAETEYGGNPSGYKKGLGWFNSLYDIVYVSRSSENPDRLNLWYRDARVRAQNAGALGPRERYIQVLEDGFLIASKSLDGNNADDFVIKCSN